MYYYEEYRRFAADNLSAANPRARSAAAEIWLRCGRRALAFTAWYGLCAAVIYALGVVGFM